MLPNRYGIIKHETDIPNKQITNLSTGCYKAYNTGHMH